MKSINCPKHTKNSWNYDARCFDCVFVDGYNKAIANLAKIETMKKETDKEYTLQNTNERIESAGKRVHLLLYGGERENDPRYTEWRADLEIAIIEWIETCKESAVIRKIRS